MITACCLCGRHRLHACGQILYTLCLKCWQKAGFVLLCPPVHVYTVYVYEIYCSLIVFVI
jgi:hypothetical protein